MARRPQPLSGSCDRTAEYAVTPIGLRRVQQMLAHGLAVEVKFVGNRRHTPPLLLPIAYVHEILQVEHWAPWSGPTFSHLGIFRPALLGNFQSALLGNFRPALTCTTDLSHFPVSTTGSCMRCR